MAFAFSVIQDQDSVQSEPVRDQANPTKIKVIGCGGGGSSGVRRMMESNVQGVEFIVMNTDLQALSKNPAPTKLAIGQKLTGGLGSGGNPEVGENAAKEDTAAIEEIVSGADMVILTAGMGGGTGTGSVPVVAEIAKKAGALTVAVVTTPFSFEGTDRMNNARNGIEKLRDCVDSLIEIPNESVFKIIDNEITFVQAFQIADELLCQGVKGITEIITKEGLVNRDFNDMQTVLKNAGETLLGVGEGVGENRAIDAAQMAISNPMLENIKIDGASKILINITGPAGVKMNEIRELINTVTASAAPKNHILWGQIQDDSMGDKIRVVVIATGFNAPVTAPAVEPEPVRVKRDDVISTGELENLLNMTPAASSFSSEVSSDPASYGEVKQPWGENLFDDGGFEPVKSSYSNNFAPPPDFSGQNDISQPACWRNQNNDLPKGINFSDN